MTWSIKALRAHAFVAALYARIGRDDMRDIEISKMIEAMSKL